MCNLDTQLLVNVKIWFLRMPRKRIMVLINGILMIEPSFIHSSNGVLFLGAIVLLLGALFQFNPIEFRWLFVQVDLIWKYLSIAIQFCYLEWWLTSLSIFLNIFYACTVFNRHAFQRKTYLRHLWMFFISLSFQMKNAFLKLYSRTHFKSLFNKKANEK